MVSVGYSILSTPPPRPPASALGTLFGFPVTESVNKTSFLLNSIFYGEVEAKEALALIPICSQAGGME